MALSPAMAGGQMGVRWKSWLMGRVEETNRGAVRLSLIFVDLNDGGE